jgi:hypothetical protein
MGSTINIIKSGLNVALDWQALAALNTTVSLYFDSTNVDLIDWGVQWGRQSTTNLSIPATAYTLGSKAAQGTPIANTPNQDWHELDRWSSQLGATVVGPAINSSSAGGSVINTGTTTSFALGDKVFLQDGSTFANSEIHTLAGVGGAAIVSNVFLPTLFPLTRTHTTGTVYRGAEEYNNIINVSGYNTLCFVIDNSLSAIASAYRVTFTTRNNFTVTP